jgi:hypothetical protein
MSSIRVSLQQGDACAAPGSGVLGCLCTEWMANCTITTPNDLYPATPVQAGPHPAFHLADL